MGEREQGGLSSPTSRRLTCSKCRCPVDASERLAHYQSAWHLHNLRCVKEALSQLPEPAA